MLRSRERASVVLENNFIQQESNLTHKNTLLERERERETRNCVRTRDIYIYIQRERERTVKAILQNGHTVLMLRVARVTMCL